MARSDCETGSANGSLSSSSSRRNARSSPSLFRPESSQSLQQQQQPCKSTRTIIYPLPTACLASSKAETLLLSSAGDVLVSRCRESPYPVASRESTWSEYTWQSDIVGACCDAECDDLSTNVQHAAVCMNAPWNTGSPDKQTTKEQPNHFRAGLLGGAPAEVASPLHDGLRGGAMGYYDHDAENDATFANQSLHYESQDAAPAGFNDDTAIVPIRSFDYSHFNDGGNDMIPERFAVDPSDTRQRNSPPKKASSPRHETAPREPFIHGVPTFLPDFSSVRVTQVSAHPMGSHVLLISDAGLLYSYGLNDCGQLGIGMMTAVSGRNRGYIMTPTIVTPLVENGGKTIACAAGVNHSLVVVMTEEQRLVKSRSFDQTAERLPRGDSTELVMYHQMYGFGCNDFMKIGLVSTKVSKPGKSDNVLLPRRVALRCKVKSSGSRLAQGIFTIAASVDHSAALVRKKSGDVEVYSWGNASYGSLGLPHPVSTLDAPNSAHESVKTVPVPSFVASVSRTSNPTARASSLLLDDEGEYPTGLSLGRRCSFVVTSIGRCFAFGVSEEGMLGLGKGITESERPAEIAFPGVSRDERVVSVSAGASHVVALTQSGNTFAWGHRAPAGLVSDLPGNDSSSRGEFMDIAWSPERLAFEGQQGSKRPTRIVQACAGFDNTLVVAETGCVYSCGKNSGRLGLGEVITDVGAPRPLFGGLRLWQKRKEEPPVIRRKPPPKLARRTTGV